MNGAITIRGERFVLEARPNGKANYSVTALDGAGNELHSDVLNLSSATARDRFVARLHGVPPLAANAAALKLARLADAARDLSSGAAEGPAPTAGFETIDPWEDPMAAGTLLLMLVETLARFMVLPAGADVVIALWILHAWTIDAFEISPILQITSADRSSGKSRLMDLLAMLLPRPFRETNPADAVIFRVIERHLPTIMLDEADNIDWRNRSELLSMINNGYRRAGAFVWRCVGDMFEPTPFRVWAPKVLTGLKALPDTTASRCLVIRLIRKPTGAAVDELRVSRLHGELLDFRRRACRWAADAVTDLRERAPELPDGMTDRQRDNWEPLLAIAEQAGAQWRERALHAIVALHAGQDIADEGSVGEQLLRDARDAFGTDERIETAELLGTLHQLQDRPWGDWKHGKPLSPQGLAALLRKYGIRPLGVTQREGDRTFKGYARMAFEEAWRTWVPVTDCVTDSKAEPSRAEVEPPNRLPTPCDGCDGFLPGLEGTASGELEVSDAWESDAA